MSRDQPARLGAPDRQPNGAKAVPIDIIKSL